MTTAKNLPHLTNEEWVLRCENPEQRDELLSWAAKQGVPCWTRNIDARPYELDLGWCGDLIAYQSIAYQYAIQLSMADFKQMCKEYAAQTRHTAPPAPNGVRDLLLCLFAALLFGSMLSSCALARIPLGSVTRHAESDSRTRQSEPYPSRIR